MNNLEEGLYANIDSSKGEILIRLEYKKVPLTVSNFVGLAEGVLGNRGDKGFYNGLKFHRVISDFMVQGGCPNGTGTGGPGYSFPDEFDASLRHSGPGVLSMANSGPDTNGSQFFITHLETPWLDDKHAVFGYVVAGQEVVDEIRQGDRINRIDIIREGEEAKQFVVTKDNFESRIDNINKNKEKKLVSGRKKAEAEVANRWPDAAVTESGLRYIVLDEGDTASGKESPRMGSSVTVHYKGSLLNGVEFDSSYARNSPATFSVGQVIAGWNEALVDMIRGEKRLLIIPPELGYGKRGYPGVIPPDSYLIFVVELIDFS